MSPEYAMEGIFSIKSDAYSFGVLLLEIVTSRKNSGHYDDVSSTLVGHVSIDNKILEFTLLFSSIVVQVSNCYINSDLEPLERK